MRIMPSNNKSRDLTRWGHKVWTEDTTPVHKAMVQPRWHLAGTLLASLALACPPLRADQPELQATHSEDIQQSWAQHNFGGAQPQLVRDEDGGSVLEWQGNLAVDRYFQRVSNAGGNLNSYLQPGDYYKAALQANLRATRPDGGNDFLQFGLTKSNDRAVLSLYPRQINNLQLGRNSKTYMLAVGDVAPNFSSLSSSLGARGLYGQYQWGDTTVYGYSGVVADSWEALEGTVEEARFLRDVHGLKIQYQALPTLTFHATTQHGEDREGSFVSPFGFTPDPVTTDSTTAGFQYAEGAYQATGEVAYGRSQPGTNEVISGQAHLLDLTWRGQGALGARAGYHALDPGFSTLSYMAQSGVEETYLGGDWGVTTWLNLSCELRTSQNRTLATTYSPETVNETDSGNLRGNITFGPNLPGWSMQVQLNDSRTRDSLDQVNRNGQTTASLSYASPAVNVSLGFGQGLYRSQSYPDSNSDSASWQFNLNRVFSDADDTTPATWTLNAGLNGAYQEQVMVLGGSETNNTNYNFTLNAQRANWGNLQILISDGLVQQPNGAPGLRQRSYQLDATRPLPWNGNLKLYVRDTRRNINDPLLEAVEQMWGFQLMFTL